MNGYPRFGWVDILRFQQSDSIRFVCQAEGMRNRMYGGVGGAKCEVGDKYL